MTQTTRLLSHTPKLTGMRNFFKNSSKSLRIALVLSVVAMAFATNAFATTSSPYTAQNSNAQQPIVGIPYTTKTTTDGKNNFTTTYHLDFTNHWSNKIGYTIQFPLFPSKDVNVTSVNVTPIGNSPLNPTYTGGIHVIDKEVTIDSSIYRGNGSTYTMNGTNEPGDPAHFVGTDGSAYQGTTYGHELVGYGDTDKDLYFIMQKDQTLSYDITVHATRNPNVQPVPQEIASLMCGNQQAWSGIAVSSNMSVAVQFDNPPWSQSDDNVICSDFSKATVVAPAAQTTPQVTTPTATVPSVSTPVTTPVTTPLVQQPTNTPVAHDGATVVSGLQPEKTPQQVGAQTPAGSSLTPQLQTPAQTSIQTPVVSPVQTDTQAQTSLYNDAASVQHVTTQTPSSTHQSATLPATRNDGVIHLSSKSHVSKTAELGVLPASLLVRHSAKHNYSLYAMWAFLVTAMALYLFMGVRKYAHQRVQSASVMRVSFHEIAQPRLVNEDSFATVPSSHIRDENLHIIDVYRPTEQTQSIIADSVAAESVSAILPSVMSIGIGVPSAKRKVTMPSATGIAAADNVERLAKPLTSRIAIAYASRSESTPSRFDLPTKIWNELVERCTRQHVKVSVPQRKME